MYLQSQACRALGTLYSKVGKLKDAMESLERHFELLKALIAKEKMGGPSSRNADGTASADTSLQALDLARVYVGVSKGNYMMNTYMQVIKYEMDALLGWKLNRSDIKVISVEPESTTTSV